MRKLVLIAVIASWTSTALQLAEGEHKNDLSGPVGKANQTARRTGIGFSMSEITGGHYRPLPHITFQQIVSNTEQWNHGRQYYHRATALGEESAFLRAGNWIPVSLPQPSSHC